MLKGTQRRMVEVKLKDNKIYESACFIFRQGVGSEKKSEVELVEEARRIITSLDPSRSAKVKQKISVVVLSLLVFTVGACAGFFVSYLF